MHLARLHKSTHASTPPYSVMLLACRCRRRRWTRWCARATCPSAGCCAFWLCAARRMWPAWAAEMMLLPFIVLLPLQALAESLDAAVRESDPYFNKLLRILATRCMTQAAYFGSGDAAPAEYHHYGLAAPLYTHFTSPIRRHGNVLAKLVSECFCEAIAGSHMVATSPFVFFVVVTYVRLSQAFYRAALLFLTTKWYAAVFTFGTVHGKH